MHSGETLDRVLMLHSGVAQAWGTDAAGRRRLMYLYAGKAPCGPEEGSAAVQTLTRRSSGSTGREV